MSQILRQYIDEEGLQVTEYTRDGVTVSAIIRQPAPIEPIEPVEPIESQPTIEEKILVETQYQTILLEMSTMF